RQHERDYRLTDVEAIADLAAYNPSALDSVGAGVGDKSHQSSAAAADSDICISTLSSLFIPPLIPRFKALTAIPPFLFLDYLISVRRSKEFLDSFQGKLSLNDVLLFLLSNMKSNQKSARSFHTRSWRPIQSPSRSHPELIGKPRRPRFFPFFAFF